jgi:hypothetical protein
VPLDRNARVRVMMVARALMRHEAYGKISAKALAVLTALLWRFHNAATGKCFPVIRGDHRGRRLRQQHVYEAIRAVEQVGVLSWVNRSSAFASTSPACSATRCDDVARSRVAGSAFSRLAPGAARR